MVHAWPSGIVALVPVYNHHQAVGVVVAQLRAVGASVLVIDDGSTDGSHAVAEQAGGTVHRLHRNCGKGEALRTGLALASSLGYQHAVSVDADGQHPTAAALRLACAAGSPTTILVGCRDMQLAPRVSRFGRWWSNLWVWLCCGAWVGDSQSGLRAYPLPNATRLAVRAGHYAWEVEVLVRAVWAGLSVEHLPVPVIYPPDRVSHFHAARDNLRTAWAFFRLSLRRFWPWHERLAMGTPRRWRQILGGNLAPAKTAQACALGAALGIAPLPGMQMMLCIALAWRWRLNIPLTVLISNHTFGPMLALWYAVATALGLRLITREPLRTAFQHIHGELLHAHGWHDILVPLRSCLAAWLLGSVVLMAVVAPLAGLVGYLVARRAQRAPRPAP